MAAPSEGFSDTERLDYMMTAWFADAAVTPAQERIIHAFKSRSAQGVRDAIDAALSAESGGDGDGR